MVNEAQSQLNKTAGREAVKQNMQGLVHALQDYPPFDRMHVDNLQSLLSRGVLAFFNAGEVVLGPEEGICEQLHIIRQGVVSLYVEQPDTEAEHAPSPEAIFGAGDMFALDALLHERVPNGYYVASEDCFCIIIAKEDFMSILKRSEPLRLFAFRGISSLFGQLYEQARQTAYEQSSPSISLSAKIKGLVQREAVSCMPTTTVVDAVAIMHQEGVSSIVVRSNEGALPEGIFTLRDLRRIVANDASALQGIVSEVMTTQPICLNEQASAFEATMLMAQHHIGHICVMRGTQLLGVISERDVFALQRVDLVNLSRQLRYAPNKTGLIEAQKDMPALVTMMLAHGASAKQLMDVVTQLNDHIGSRAIELCLSDYPEINFDFNWMLFGSEGRGEQTLLSDQDNAIVFASHSAEQTEARRALLLPFAKQVNELLDACGLAWCKGNIMASNPKLCLSLEEWKQTFDRLVDNPSPRHLLESSIYFDLRRLWGKAELFDDLRQYLRQQCLSHTRFQRALARVAIIGKPPTVDSLRSLLGVTLRTRTSVDLKYQGINPFVNGIRVLALTIGCTESNTHDRIQYLRKKSVFSAADARSYTQAFHYLQLLRMQQHQEQSSAAMELSNLVEPSKLDALDKRLLRESLRQARLLQTVIKLRYRI